MVAAQRNIEGKVDYGSRGFFVGEIVRLKLKNEGSTRDEGARAMPISRQYYTKTIMFTN